MYLCPASLSISNFLHSFSGQFTSKIKNYFKKNVDFELFSTVSQEKILRSKERKCRLVYCYTDKKKKTRFCSYIKKFRWD
jgi:hypothetical protein